MGHSEIGVTMNVYGHLFQDEQEQLTNDLDALVERTRSTVTGAGGLDRSIRWPNLTIRKSHATRTSPSLATVPGG
jgi:hypothetical protein